jgi:hypothetical protein
MIPVRVRRKIRLDPIEGCWIWIGAANSNGYGRISVGPRATRKVWLIHRLLYTMYKGDIPNGYDIDHGCANRYCCNPRHLTAVTHEANMREMFHRRKSIGISKVH